MAVAVLAEPEPGGDGNVSLFNEEFCKFKRAKVLKPFRNRDPGEHAGLRRHDLPSRAPERVHHRRAADPVNVADFLNGLFAVIESGRGRNLDRREGPVVEVGFDPRQGRDQLFVADRKSHAPAGHGKGLGKRRKFHRHIHRAFDLQDRRRRIIVIIDFRVGEIG